MNTIHHSSLTFDTVKRLACGQWRHILFAAGIPDHLLTGRAGPCPACSGTDRFRFDDQGGNGSFYCNQCGGQNGTGGGGDGFALIEHVHRCSSIESLNLVAGILGITAYTPEPWQLPEPVQTIHKSDKQEQAKRQRAIERVWKKSVKVTPGDPVWQYLTQTRGLKLQQIPEALRLHPALGYWIVDDRGQPKQTGTYPAMVAAVLSPSGKLVNVQRIYLTQDGQKAPVPECKKLMTTPKEGALRGAAIRLYEAGELLAVSEGIETGLACYEATGIPTWATYSACNMESFVVPQSVRELIIFADHDRSERGQKAARKLARRTIAAGIKTKILIPPVAGTDWLDTVTKGAI
jgi:putative DNA primase/helicase